MAKEEGKKKEDYIPFGPLDFFVDRERGKVLMGISGSEEEFEEWLKHNFPGMEVEMVEPGFLARARAGKAAASKKAKREAELRAEIAAKKKELEGLRHQRATGGAYVLLKEIEALEAELESG